MLACFETGRLTHEDFEALVGTRFSLTPEASGPVAAELLSVALHRPSVAPTGRHAFVLQFRAETADCLPQMIYPLTHDRFGRLDAFLVPVGRDAGGLLLEAVFS